MTRMALSSASIRIFSRAFDHLLQLNLDGTPWGWRMRPGWPGCRVDLERKWDHHSDPAPDLPGRRRH